MSNAECEVCVVLAILQTSDQCGLFTQEIVDIEATPMPKVQRKTAQVIPCFSFDLETYSLFLWSSVAVEDVIMVDDIPVPKRKASSGLVRT